jgi:hypothetical protein
MVCLAQTAPQAAPATAQPDASSVYCSGFVTDQRVSDEIRLISSEQSDYKVIYERGDYVHINRGTNQGIKEGDRFMVVRPQGDPLEVRWFKWQSKLMKAMGTPYVDAGRMFPLLK